MATNVRHRLGFTLNTLSMTGKDNWVFLRDSRLAGRHFLDKLRGARPLGDETLALFAKRLDKIEKRLAAQGVDFMLSIVPEKHSIYREYMPVNVRRVGPSRLDQVNSLLSGSDYYFDTKSVLVESREAAGERPLYYVVDSHWNCWGAYLSSTAGCWSRVIGNEAGACRFCQKGRSPIGNLTGLMTDCNRRSTGFAS
ncbi:MAG: hypothetical protein U5K56_13825 [Halioglobus sp.]|nr:hypothetical protein [Halioglobus sp.]